MIVFVGNELKIGGLIDAAKNRMGEDVVCIEESFNILKQENDILLKSEGASFIVYDTESYLNDSEDIIRIIKRIYRTNRAKPILLVPTDNPKSEIIKCAVEQQIKSFVNTSLPMSDQKDQFEKAIAGFYDSNETETVAAAAEAVEEENLDIKRFVGELYDAKQREEKRENTVIINQKGTPEVLLTFSVRLLRTIISIIIFILAAVGIATLLYPDIRAAFMKEFMHVINVLQGML